MKNTRYNVFTFLPLCLFNYFKVFFNLYFLGMTISQMIPIFNLGYLYAYALPLFAFVLFYLAKEGYDDYKRYMTDR